MLNDSHNTDTYLQGGAYIPFRQPGVNTSLLSIKDDNTHAKYRKLVSNAYAMSSMSSFEPRVNEMISRLSDVLRRHAITRQPINLTKWSYYCKSH